MELIRSRKNQHIRHLRLLGRDADYRRASGEFLCDGEKLLSEALRHGAVIGEALVRQDAAVPEIPGATVRAASDDVFDFASPLVNSPGPLFSVKMARREVAAPEKVIVLENVQDPGNLGTVLRTAASLGVDLVVLAGNCADPFNPKTVRSAMGALFRQPFSELTLDGLTERLSSWGLPLYGAALTADAADVRSVDLRRAAVAVGNEGHGLSRELLDRCRGEIIIPMTPESESLNAAVAAAVLMWEMNRDRE